MKVRIGCLVVGFLSLALTLVPNACAADTVLYNFAGPPDGAEPYSTLITDKYGNLFGTTAYGGSANCYISTGCGTVFVLCAPHVTQADLYPCQRLRSSWEEHILYTFTGGRKDGAVPYGSLVMLTGGHSHGAFTLYGTTYYGGNSTCQDQNGQLNCGTVFELCAPKNDGGCSGANNTWTEKVVHNFTGGTRDGSFPFAGVITDGSGNLYGTTVYGGGKGICNIGTTNNFCGTVFTLKGGNPWRFPETILHHFKGAVTGCYGAGTCDGANPYAALNLQGKYLFGTTLNGGNPTAHTPQSGMVFDVKICCNFPYFVDYFFGNFLDGTYPYADLIFDKAGNLYGTTSAGGPDGGGIAFELTPHSPYYTETVLYPFCSIAACADGANPTAGFVWDAVGNLYGTTFYGGIKNMGLVFELTPGGPYWTETPLNSFAGGAHDGADPWAGVIFDPPVSAVELYGTTVFAGAGNAGIVYSVP